MKLKTQLAIAICLLLLSSCATEQLQPHIQPGPELIAEADPLPEPKAKTMNELVGEDLALMNLYQICKVENDTKAHWIQDIYK